MRPNEGAFLAGMLGFMCVVVAIALVIAIFYFLTLQKALNRVSRRNRLMEPGLVWLGIIPVFSVIWSFFIATRVPDSLRNEFRDQGRDDGTDYGRGIGLANAIIGAISVPLQVISNVSRDAAFGFVMFPVGLASLVLFIIFWVKIAGYSSKLAAPAPYPRGGEEFDDEEHDDYPDRRPRGGPSDAIRPDDRDRYER